MIVIGLIVGFHQILQPVEITLHLIKALDFLAGPKSVDLYVALCNRPEGCIQLFFQLVDINGSFATNVILSYARLDHPINKSRLIDQLKAEHFDLRLQHLNRILMEDTVDA